MENRQIYSIIYLSIIYLLSAKLDIREMMAEDVRPHGGCCRPRILRKSLFALEQTSRRKRSIAAILSLSSYFLSAKSAGSFLRDLRHPSGFSRLVCSNYDNEYQCRFFIFFRNSIKTAYFNKRED